MELNKNIIAPVRIKIEKREIDKVRVGCTICLILFVLSISIFCGHWYFTDYKEMKLREDITILPQQIINETYCEVDYSMVYTKISKPKGL